MAKNQGYKNAVVALAVVLAIAVAVAILMAMLAGKDCMAHALIKNKENAERRARAAKTNGVMNQTGSRHEDSQYLTQDANDTLSDINVQVDDEGGMMRREYTTLNDMPRQKGRRAERVSGDGGYGRMQTLRDAAVIREEDRDDRSDSGMSSANTSTSAQVHSHSPYDPQDTEPHAHAHQGSSSSSSSSSHGGARPKQPLAMEESPPSYRSARSRTLPELPQGGQQPLDHSAADMHSGPYSPTTPTVPSAHHPVNMYKPQEDLSAGYATPYNQSETSFTPRSVHSETDAYSPADHPQPPPRGAHTDVPRGNRGRQELPSEGDTRASRGYYTDPKKLEFSAGQSGEGSRKPSTSSVGEVYVDQTSTVI